DGGEGGPAGALDCPEAGAGLPQDEARQDQEPAAEATCNRRRPGGQRALGRHAPLSSVGPAPMPCTAGAAAARSVALIAASRRRACLRSTRKPRSAGAPAARG